MNWLMFWPIIWLMGAVGPGEQARAEGHGAPIGRICHRVGGDGRGHPGRVEAAAAALHGGGGVEGAVEAAVRLPLGCR